MIAIDDFAKVELVVAQIKDVQEHPNADKLYVLKVDVGEESPRQLVAGIRKAYKPEALIGRKIIVVKNLQPATLRGVESCGMLLAAKDENGLALLGIDKDIAVGSRVS